MKKALLLLAGFLFLAVLPAAAQEDEGTFIFMPQWSAQAQFAGYYVAKELGFYEKEGLDVQIMHPFPTQPAMEKIIAHQCHATTLPLSLALEVVDSGIPLVNILQTSMNNATLIVSRWGEDPLKLKGAKVAAIRAGFGQLAKSVAMKENLDYEWITTASCVNLFIAGAVEATLAKSYNEYYQLLQTGIIKPGVGVFRFEENGYNIQQEGVYVTREFYEAHQDQAERFARASRLGWDWALDHPEEALDIVMEYVRRDRIATNRVLQELMLQEVLRLQEDRDSKVREFRLRPDMLEQANQLLGEAHLLKRHIALEELLP